MLGANVITARAAPKISDVSATKRIDTALRRATASAPISEPTLTTERSSVNVASPPPKSRVTNSGNTTWKL